MTRIVELDRSRLAEVLEIYPAAFPDEELRPVVRELAALPEVLHLAAQEGDALLGHVAFTPGQVGGHRVALLGPLAVHPDRQKMGLGAALVTAGLARSKQDGAALALVLGDPGYYGRFGFAPETQVTPPYPMPADWAPAWQSVALRPGADLEGRLKLPPVWMQPELWAD
ncbi:GNAT family N-acetyltransferase [Thalassobius sp. S69A]|uniref:GNAT family N-acetyltransferase n=1 Tax=unclassified Thalassovita TaxID=2619711 RepID=UPI000C0EBD0D|nr:GNAT family N-acetyltransferase [Paracoccaceae bacterium]MBT25838.1 GNAT family N-acetyltransferase [Paracoccaceae bacterium]